MDFEERVFDSKAYIENKIILDSTKGYLTPSYREEISIIKPSSSRLLDRANYLQKLDSINIDYQKILYRSYCNMSFGNFEIDKVDSMLYFGLADFSDRNYSAAQVYINDELTESFGSLYKTEFCPQIKIDYHILNINYEKRRIDTIKLERNIELSMKDLSIKNDEHFEKLSELHENYLSTLKFKSSACYKRNRR